MLNPQIFVAADTVTAIMLALGFLTAYLVDRKLAAFRWWAGFYMLFAVTISLTGSRIEANSIWIEVTSWTSLYAAVSLAAYGMYREGEGRIRPHKAIAMGAVLLAAIIVTLSAMNADSAIWELLGSVPTVALILLTLLRFVRQTSRGICDWCYGLALLAWTVMIATRAVWFANLLLQLHQSSPLGSDALDQALVMSFATIITMVVLAIALILRISLTAVNRMRERSTTDAMTGLLNRATFDERAEQALLSHARRPICAIILDIDHFKPVNDTFGHQAGDRVIAELGRIILGTASNQQIAGRIGGEEFAIVLLDSTLAAARLCAEAIRTRFAASTFNNEVTRTVTLSAGVALRQKNEPLHALLARADAALYNAKKRGRNLVVIGLADVNADRSKKWA